MLLARYGSTGTAEWSFARGGLADDQVTGSAPTASGGVVATGSFEDTIGFGYGPHTSAGGEDAFLLFVPTE